MLSFLESVNPTAAINAEKMEHLIFEDPSSSLVKARVFAEEILNGVLQSDGISVHYLSSMHEKVSYLGKEGYIVKEIQNSFNNIRFAGNRAAHDGTFDDIGEALKIHKVMYTIAVWYCEVYSKITVSIPPYLQPKPKTSASFDLDQIKREIIESIAKKDFSEIDEIRPKENKLDKKAFDILVKDLSNEQSYLSREIKRLQESAQEAVENANTFSRFKDYMHVERKLQKDFEALLERANESGGSQLLFLSGSVGDGKSHLLAYLNSTRKDLLSDFTIFNDATESFSPNKNAMETLEEVLAPFSDQSTDKSDEKVILAINLGVLHNFINHNHSKYTFKKLSSFVDESGLFSQQITTVYSKEQFNVLSFGDYHTYEITENGAKSSFYSTLLSRVFAKSDQNPFYLAYLEDRKNNIQSILHRNFEFLMDEFVQHQIVQLIIQCIIQYKLVISARSFMNFIADIVVPEEELQNTQSDFENLDLTVSGLLFNRRDRSPILKKISLLDPVHYRAQSIDELIIKMNTLNNWSELKDEYIPTTPGREILKPFIIMENLEGDSFKLLCEHFIRISYLTNKSFVKSLENNSFINYLKNLYYFNSGVLTEIEKVYEQLKLAIFKWRGTPKRGYIYINKPNEKTRLAQYLNLRPSINHLKPFHREQTLFNFKPTITIGFRSNEEKVALLDIDYSLYQLLSNVIAGYCPNKKDEEEAIKFVEFLEEIMKFGNKKEELLVHFPNDQKMYTLKKNDFGSFVFERE